MGPVALPEQRRRRLHLNTPRQLLTLIPTTRPDQLNPSRKSSKKGVVPGSVVVSVIRTRTNWPVTPDSGEPLLTVSQFDQVALSLLTLISTRTVVPAGTVAVQLAAVQVARCPASNVA